MAISAAKRQRVYERDGRKCSDCSTRQDLTIDHRWPKSKGGCDCDVNLITMCRPCNNKKGDSIRGHYCKRHPPFEAWSTSRAVEIVDDDYNPNRVNKTMLQAGWNPNDRGS